MEGRLERCYVELGTELVPLYVEARE